MFCQIGPDNPTLVQQWLLARLASRAHATRARELKAAALRNHDRDAGISTTRHLHACGLSGELMHQQLGITDALGARARASAICNGRQRRRATLPARSWCVIIRIPRQRAELNHRDAGASHRSTRDFG